ncbi:hypothetical protein [Arthrobacter sp. NPDC092385]|uniref:hypothetical protein n=1 Tax=Arthrobacter sp. NPDC092385 TaxID=3363943 RepID=UPI00380A2D21
MDVVQLLVNVGALVGGAVIWKLYVDNLKSAVAVKDAAISSVEKNRDMWRDKAQELEKRSPEFMERMLSERIQTRESEISRLAEDKGRHEEALTLLEREKANLEADLSRSRGFSLMLALEEEEYAGDEEDVENEVESPASMLPQVGQIKVVRLGEVGVDSGQLMITDPCYIDQEWQHDLAVDDEMLAKITSEQPLDRDRVDGDDQRLRPYSYRGVMETTLTTGYGDLAYRLGHAGAGVAFSTAWGDGVYPVYGEMHDGRIIRVYINVG